MSVLHQAALPKWMKIDPHVFYKAIMTENVAGLKANDRVWLKQNTEFPFRGGITYWCYDPVRRTAAHISEAVVQDYVKLFTQQGNIAPATSKEQKVLDQHWLPFVKQKVDNQRKISKKYLRDLRTRND